MIAVDLDAKWAQTLDGQLCDDGGRSQWISGPKERLATHELRAGYDAVLVGAGTYLEDRCLLTVRQGPAIADARQPSRVIVDPRGKLAALVRARAPGYEAMLEDLTGGPRDTFVISPDPASLGATLPRAGRLRWIATDLDFEDANFGEKLKGLLRELPAKCDPMRRRVLVEGGPRLITRLLDSGACDRLLVSISPQITGGISHRISLGRSLAGSFKTELENVQLLGMDVLLTLAVWPRGAVA